MPAGRIGGQHRKDEDFSKAPVGGVTLERQARKEACMLEICRMASWMRDERVNQAWRVQVRVKGRQWSWGRKVKANGLSFISEV